MPRHIDNKANIEVFVRVTVFVSSADGKHRRVRHISMLPAEAKKHGFGVLGSAIQRETYEAFLADTEEVLMEIEKEKKPPGECKGGKNHIWRPIDELQDQCSRCESFRISPRA